jgi:hypothetical protein
MIRRFLPRKWKKTYQKTPTKTKSESLLLIPSFTYQSLHLQLSWLWLKHKKILYFGSAADAYQVLTNREKLEIVLQQGLKEGHMQYKESFTNMKDRIMVEDLTVY